MAMPPRHYWYLLVVAVLVVCLVSASSEGSQNYPRRLPPMSDGCVRARYCAYSGLLMTILS